MSKLSVLLFIVALTNSYTEAKEWQNGETCGISFSKRIVGGKLVPDGKYPWIARLGYGTSIPGRYVYLCGGALITPTFVLTAAHCLVNKKQQQVKIVHVGETTITCTTSPCTDSKVQEIEVKRIISHENFSTANANADIALIQLTQPAKLTTWVRTICLSNKAVPKVGEQGITAGWGMENYITRERPGGLKELTMEIILSDRCKKTFPQADFSSPNYICGGGKKGEDTCGGDSGGPFMKILNLDKISRMHLIGVVSFGSTKCGVGVPGIFTSVSHHMEWITKHVLG